MSAAHPALLTDLVPQPQRWYAAPYAHTSETQRRVRAGERVVSRLMPEWVFSTPEECIRTADPLVPCEVEPIGTDERGRVVFVVLREL